MEIENTKCEINTSNATFGSVVRPGILVGSFGGLLKHPTVVSLSSKHLHTGMGVASQSQIPLPEHMDGQNML